MQRIYLVTRDGAVSTVHMPYELALSKLRTGEIEEVYEVPGIAESFKGVRLRESPMPTSERFHRGSLSASDCSLTESDSLGNVGALSQKANNRAFDRVQAWPLVHDTYALTVCAGPNLSERLIRKTQCADLTSVSS